ncbi:acyl-CoA thioesterase [bacterium]|nr:acyl-CoA thioesterase [bacterium]
MSEKYREPAIRMVMMPRDTNHLGSIFGGHILSLIDQAAGYEARRNAAKKFVTKVLREVEFIAPVHVGDLVSFYTETKKVGRTSVQISVEVVALRGEDCLTEQKVTSADVVMVAVDEMGNPVPIS